MRRPVGVKNRREKRIFVPRMARQPLSRVDEERSSGYLAESYDSLAVEKSER
jgi:hypothetical protein